MTVQEFFIARELAEIAKEAGDRMSFPKSERGVRKLAEREGWNNQPSNLARKRSGRDGGGGMEYNFAILPPDMQMVIRHRDRQASFLAAQEIQAKQDRVLIEQQPNMSLKGRQARVRDARAQVLQALDQYTVKLSLRRQEENIRKTATRSDVIADFMRAQRAWGAFKLAGQARDAGETLTAAQRTLLAQVPALVSDQAFGLTEEVVVTANDRKNASASIGRSTLYQWFKMRREGTVEALAPALTKEQEEVSEAFKVFLRYYAMPAKPMISKALKDYNKDHPEALLSYDQVRQTLKTKLNDIERNVGREGLLTLRSRMAYVTRITDEYFLPSTIYVADGKTFDAEIADWNSNRPMKPELTSIIDVATRKCVGWAVSRKENTVAVTEALRNACVDHSIPAMFYTDRGAGYKNKIMDEDESGLLARLSITKMHALPYNSQAKGNIERFNRTVWNPLAQTFPTYLGKDMDKEAAQFVHKKTRRDIKEFGHSPLLPAWDDFRAKCEAAVDAYNAEPHEGLPKFVDPQTGRKRHMSPNDAWAAHVAEGWEAVPVEDDLKDDLFRPYVQRTANRGLVKWNSNEFFHAGLLPYNGKKVLVGYDDMQAQFVWVREMDAKTGAPGALICKADFSGNKERYIPLTAQRKAEEIRNKGQIRRLDEKRNAINEELGNPYQIEHRPEVPLDPVTAPPTPVEAQNVVYDMVPNTKLRRRTFLKDDELCAFALDNFEELEPVQIDFIRKLLSKKTDRNWLAMSGIDVDRLTELVRAAA